MALTAAVILGLMGRLLYLVGPHEALIFTGRRYPASDGGVRSFRVVRGGRAIRIPIIEAVERVDLRPMRFEFSLSRLRSQQGSLDLHAVAAVRISPDPQLIERAMERFLGRSGEEIVNVARQALEAATREAVSRLRAEEALDSRSKLAEDIHVKARQELEPLGLELDQLQILDLKKE
jgi:flotillin